jgi:hypothetical protein
MRRFFELSVFLALVGATPFASSAETRLFVVAEISPFCSHCDSFVLPLSDPADIADARTLINEGPFGSVGSIPIVEITAGSDGTNRDVLASGEPLWSWHVSDFSGFFDFAIELCDGWPGFIEQDPAAFLANTGGSFCPWTYTVIEELPTPTATPTPIPAVEMASGTVGAGGGSVSTGTTASSSDPVETTVTVPAGTAGGMVVITEGPITETPPSDFSFRGQQVDITTPAGTVGNPLVFTFSLFAPGMAPSGVEIFKTTVLVGPCVDASANPDPCVESRTKQGADNIVNVVRTSTASPWNLPEPGLLIQLASGLLGLVILDKRRRSANKRLGA